MLKRKKEISKLIKQDKEKYNALYYQREKGKLDDDSFDRAVEELNKKYYEEVCQITERYRILQESLQGGEKKH